MRKLFFFPIVLLFLLTQWVETTSAQDASVATPVASGSTSAPSLAGPPEIPEGELSGALPDFDLNLQMPSEPVPSSTSDALIVSTPAISSPTAVLKPTEVPAVLPVKTEPAPTKGTQPVAPVATAVPVAPVKAVLPVKAGAPSKLAKDYFPTLQGQKREYQFYSLPDQTVGRKNRVVECLKSETFPNSTVRSTLKTTVFAGGGYQDEISTDTFSAYANWVAQTSRNGQPMTGCYLLKVPPQGGTERWNYQEKDGTTKYYKATFSPLTVGDKIYGDCLMVVEKTLNGTSELSLRNYYFARGVGLVRLEVYGKDLKVDRSASIDLVEASN